MAPLGAPGLSGKMSQQRGQDELDSPPLVLLIRCEGQNHRDSRLLALAPTPEDSCVSTYLSYLRSSQVFAQLSASCSRSLFSATFPTTQHKGSSHSLLPHLSVAFASPNLSRPIFCLFVICLFLSTRTQAPWWQGSCLPCSALHFQCLE